MSLHRFASVALGLLIVVTASHCNLAGPLAGSTDLPSDVSRLGAIRPASADESAGAISAAKASEAAAEAGYDRPSPKAYLVVLADSASEASGSGPVWLIRWDNLTVEHAAPSIGLEPSVYHYLYVLVDARSGGVIDATYME